MMSGFPLSRKSETKGSGGEKHLKLCYQVTRMFSASSSDDPIDSRPMDRNRKTGQPFADRYALTFIPNS